MLNVVIVEDEMLVRLGMKMCIDEYSGNMKVAAAFASAEEAIKYFKDHPVDILITDIRLAGMDGLELISQIRSKTAQMVTVVLSCYEEFAYARRAMELGVDKYILKHELAEDELPKMLEELYQRKQKKYGELAKTSGSKRPFDSGTGDKKFRIACVNLRGTGEKYNMSQENTNLEMLTEIFQEILNLNHLGESFLRHGSEVFCILNFDTKETEEQIHKKVLDFYQNALKNMKNYFNKNLYLIVTDTFEQLGEVGAEFERAKKYCSLSFYYEKPQIFFLSELVSEGFLKDANGRETSEHVNLDMEELFTEPWFEGTAKKMVSFLDNQKKFLVPAEDVKLEIVRMIHKIEELLEKYLGVGIEELFPKEERPNYLYVNQFDSCQELKVWLLDMLKKIQEQLIDKESTIHKIVLYLEENFYKEISLKEIAEHFHMNMAYFCQYFKKYTGDTFVHYLNFLRIEKAKPLLLSGEESVEQIAEKVGIMNSNYFFRVFKKITGKTVGEFRKSYIKGERKVEIISDSSR